MMQIADKNGDYPTMIAAATRQSAEFPRDGMAPYYLGLAKYYQGDFAGALQNWHKARRLDAALQTRIAPLENRVRRIQKRLPNLKLGAIQMVSSDMGRGNQSAFELGKKLMGAGDTAEIERVAQRLEREKTAGLDGQWHLDSFLQGVEWQEDTESQQADWQQLIRRLELWKKAQPASVFPVAALIHAQTNWAGQLRGTEFASEVTDAQWQGMREHLALAAPLVAQLSPTALRSPTVCAAVLSWSHLSGVPEPQMRAMWADFERRFPDSTRLFAIWSHHLLPQWGGALGERERYAQKWASLRPGEAGDIRYAQWASRSWSYLAFTKAWQQKKADWPRARRGFQALLRAHPQSVSLATALMEMAQQNGDHATAQNALVQRVRDRASTSRYRSPREFAVLRLQILDPQGKTVSEFIR